MYLYLRQSLVALLVFTLVFPPGLAYGHGPGPAPVGLKSVQKSTLPDPGTFTNFETPHVHPLDISPNNSKLAAVNTADARVEIYDIDGSGNLTHTDSISVGLDPVTARFRTNTELWVVNHISDSISIVNVSTGHVTKTIEVEDEPADVVFFTDGGNSDPLAAVSCSRPDIVQIYNATTCALVDTFDVLGEDPRGLATNGSDVYGAIFNSGNSTTIIGHDVSSLGIRTALDDTDNPYGGLAGSQKQAYNNGIPGTEWVTPHGNSDMSDFSGIEPPQVGIIVRKDFDDGNKWKDDNGADWTEWVSGAEAAQSDRPVGWDMIDNDMFSISTSSGSTTLDGSFGASGYVINRMNICMAIGVNPVGGNVVMIGTEATNEIRFEPVLTGTFVRTRVAIQNPTTGANIALVDMNEEHLDAAQGGVGLAYSDSSVAQTERDKSIGDPRGIAFHPADGRIYITGMGSNNIIVLDKDTGERLGGTGYTIETGVGPTGAKHHGTLDRLYVHCKFSAEIDVIDTTTIGSESVVQTVGYYDPTPDWINTGRVHMYDTHANSGLGQIACASCHIDSQMDRLAWDLGNPVGSVKNTVQIANLADPQAGEHNLATGFGGTFDNFHPMKGPMTTQTLQDIIGKEPHHWRGDQDGIEGFAGAFDGLQGRDASLDALSMQEFEDFLSSIHFPPNDFRPIDNSLAGGPKFYGAGDNPDMPLPNHFTTGRFAAAGTQLPDGDAFRGFQLFVDGDPDFVDNNPALDGGTHCVTCHALPMGAGSIDFFNGSTFVDIAPGPNGEAHQLMVAVDDTGEDVMKVAPTRNQMDKVGFFIAPDPGNGGAPRMSRAGFGLLHDGSVAGLDEFLSSPVFDVQSDQDVADLVAFSLSMNGSDFENLMGLTDGPTGFPAGVVGSRAPGPDGGEARTAHAGVGKQVTIDTFPLATADSDLIDLMIDMADDQVVDLIVKGKIPDRVVGLVWDAATDMFINDNGATVSELAVTTVAAPGEEITFTLVPAGSGIRMGIDRDEDGTFDGVEESAGVDPADPTSKLVYVDFDFNGTEDGLQSTPFDTLDEALNDLDSGVIRINGSSAVTETAEIFTGGNVISKNVRIEANPAGGSGVRIGVVTKGTVILREGGPKPQLSESSSTSTEESNILDDFPMFQWFLNMLAQRYGKADSDDKSKNGAEIREGEVSATVLPYTRAATGERIIEEGTPLAFRLQGESNIDPQSVWGAPEGTKMFTTPSEEGDMRDVWVLVAPDEGRYFSGILDVAVEGATDSGAAVTNDGGTFTADTRAERADVPGLPDVGIDQPQGIFPETVYATPQQIWLPLPAGTPADAVQLYYYHPDGEARGWYPAENVDGWLVEDSYTVVRQGDTNYLGFQVRHAGIVQLGTK